MDHGSQVSTQKSFICKCLTYVPLKIAFLHIFRSYIIKYLQYYSALIVLIFIHIFLTEEVSKESSNKIISDFPFSLYKENNKLFDFEIVIKKIKLV